MEKEVLKRCNARRVRRAFLVLSSITILSFASCQTPDAGLRSASWTPFRIENDFIVTDAHVSDILFSAIIDTGSEISLISSEVVDRIEHSFVQNTALNFTLSRDNRGYDAKIIRVPHLHWAGNVYNDVLFAVIDPRESGFALDDSYILVGGNVLSRNHLTIDYPSQAILAQQYASQTTGNVDVVAPSMTSFPTIVATINGQNADAVLDTGSPYTVISVSLLRELPSTVEHPGLFLVRQHEDTLVRDELVPIELFQIADQVWTDVIIRKEEIPLGILLGSDVLQGFIVSIDYSLNQVSLINESSSSPPMFTDPRYGFGLGMTDDGRLVVADVIEPSAASMSGVQPGTYIVGVALVDEGEPSFSRSIDDMLSLLSTRSPVLVEVGDNNDSRSILTVSPAPLQQYW